MAKVFIRGQLPLSLIVPVIDPPFSDSRQVYAHIRQNLEGGIASAIRMRNAFK